MKKYAEVQVERKQALRLLQRQRRLLERNLNVLERQIRQKLSKKTMVDYSDAVALRKTFDEAAKLWQKVYQQLGAFSNLVSI